MRITTFFQWWELQISIFLHSRIANSAELEPLIVYQANRGRAANSAEQKNWNDAESVTYQ